MTKRIILHIDMNSYFASVEQQANPFLRGQAVGVCAYLSPGGCIIASSREAKAKGIKTGCTVREARVLDPGVVLVENEPAKYRSTTERIFAILREYTDQLEPYSIDEAFLDLTGYAADFERAERAGREIQHRIKTEVGEWLCASVGIGWTRFLAKFAGDIAPKAGVLMIDSPAKLEEILRDRPLTEAWGIADRMAARLNQLGIKDLLDLKLSDASRLRRNLGRYGYYLWANMNGVEITSVGQGVAPPKHIGHSYCIPKWTTDKEYLGSVLYKLCEKTGRRLRTAGLEAGGISVFFAYTRGGGAGRGWKTADALFTTEEIGQEASGFLAKTDILLPVRMVAISVGRLRPVSGQLSFFADTVSKNDLARAVDRINDKYGEYTVVRGAMFGTNDIAKDRIGFRKTVDVRAGGE